jgi:transcriptional regulator with XRE-family HTH domain
MKNSQAAVAKALGVSQPTISYWISGKASPSETALEKIKTLYPNLYAKITTIDKTKFKGVTQEFLLSVFQYHENGTITWKVKSKNANIGDVAGYLINDGYLQVTLLNQLLKVHRIIWFMHNGYLHENVIDHINRVKTDNRIENLREITRSCNSMNVEKDNNSGVIGVNWDKNKKSWTANLFNNTKTFINFDEAVKARFDAEIAGGQTDCMRSAAYNHKKKKKNRAMNTYSKNYPIEELKIFDYGRI